MNASLFWTNADVPLYSSPGVVGIHWKLQEKSLAASQLLGEAMENQTHRNKL